MKNVPQNRKWYAARVIIESADKQRKSVSIFGDVINIIIGRTITDKDDIETELLDVCSKAFSIIDNVIVSIKDCSEEN